MELNKAERILDISSRCALMCGQEAEALGLPAVAGYLLHDGIVQDDIEGWPDAIYIEWCDSIIRRFGDENEEVLLELYDICGAVMERYGEMITDQIV